MKLAKHFVQGPWVYVLPIFEGGKKKRGTFGSIL